MNVLITGSTSGIGRATALAFAARGDTVFATGRTAADLDAASDALIPLVLDVTDEATIEAAHAEVMRRTGGRGLDVLINCAGFAVGGPTELCTDTDLRAQFDVNVFGLMAVTRAFVPAMRARGEGRVINVGSLAGRASFPLMGAYCATKHAVLALSNALRLELEPFGVQVTLVQPGVVNTPFVDRTMSEAAKYAVADSPYAAVVQRKDDLKAMTLKTAIAPERIVRAIVAAATAKRAPAFVTAPWWAGLGVRLLNALPVTLADAVLRALFGLGRLRAAPCALQVSHG